MSFHYSISGAITVSERLPHVHLSLAGAVTVTKGASILAKADGELSEWRVWVKTGGALIDAGA